MSSNQSIGYTSVRPFNNRAFYVKICRENDSRAFYIPFEFLFKYLELHGTYIADLLFDEEAYKNQVDGIDQLIPKNEPITITPTFILDTLSNYNKLKTRAIEIANLKFKFGIATSNESTTGRLPHNMLDNVRFESVRIFVGDFNERCTIFPLTWLYLTNDQIIEELKKEEELSKKRIEESQRLAEKETEERERKLYEKLRAKYDNKTEVPGSIGFD